MLGLEQEMSVKCVLDAAFNYSFIITRQMS